MRPEIQVETERLFLRNWVDADAEPFATLNRDPRVMEFFPRVLSRAESDALIARERKAVAERGFGLYAAEEKASGAFIGFVGVAPVAFSAAFTPAIEIGWRLTRASWGNGYATEAARAVIAHAFGSLDFTSLIAFTAAWNTRSRRVMEKIGMIRDPEGDFLHPGLPGDHKLAPHVLYRITAEAHEQAAQGRP